MSFNTHFFQTLTIEQKNMLIYHVLDTYSLKRKYFNIMSILYRYPRDPSNPPYFRKKILTSQLQLRTGSSKISQKICAKSGFHGFCV